MSFRDGNDFISNDDEVAGRLSSSGICSHEESDLGNDTEEMEEEEGEDNSSDGYYEEEGEAEEEMDGADDDAAEVENEAARQEDRSTVRGAPSSIIEATTKGGASVFQRPENSASADVFLTPSLSTPQYSNLPKIEGLGAHDPSFPSLAASAAAAAAAATMTTAASGGSEFVMTSTGRTETGPQRHAFRFLDFPTTSTTGSEKRQRFSSLSEETAAARSFLSRFELSLPTTRFDEQLEDILATFVGMSSLELLHAIRSMDSDSTVEAAHSRLLGYVEEESARHPPLTHNLCQCSMLCGAFCRRLTSLDIFTVTGALKYVDSLLLLLKKMVPSSLESTLFAYAFGEIETFRTMRHVTCRNRIDDLTRSTPAFRWDIEKITTALMELSATEKHTENTQALIGGKKRPREGNDVCGSGSAPVAVRWRLPLRDPISMSVIAIPARGVSCQHREVFDLRTFVRATQQVVSRPVESIEDAAGKKWEDGGGGGGGSSGGLQSAVCPVCRKATPLHSVRVDERIMETMRQYTQKGAVLSAEDCIVWDAATSAYCIAERPSEARENEEKVDEVQEREASRPKRAVYIGGHVLYADD